MNKRLINSDLLLFSAWGISLIASAGSLFFSEIVGYIPCDLCWYQRIFMYPLVIVLGVAVVKKDVKQALYSAIFSSIGFIIALYHYLIQKVPAISQMDSCGLVPCAGQYINWFGFITIPFLSLLAFSLILILSVVILMRERNSNK